LQFGNEVGAVEFTLDMLGILNRQRIAQKGTKKIQDGGAQKIVANGRCGRVLKIITKFVVTNSKKARNVVMPMPPQGQALRR